MIRLEILNLTETFHAPELENKTHRLYAQDATQPLSREQLKNLLHARAENAVFTNKCWALLQGFISTVTDLVVSEVATYSNIIVKSYSSVL